MSIGFRVFLQRDLPPKELVEAYKELPAPVVADCMNRLCALSSAIRLVSKPFAGSMAGPALTVKVRPGDNLLLQKALNMCREGDVVIVSNAGDDSQALIGENMVGYLQYKKAGGLVVDGPVRDIAALKNCPMPIYARGTTPGGPFKDGPGEVNVPIACGNIHVTPGDIVLGDEDGVIIIPLRDAAGLLDAARTFYANDQAKGKASRDGTVDRNWIEKALEAKGCEIIDGVCR